METVRSSDGCRIAYERSGRGSPLVLVGGAFSTRETSAPAAAALDGDFAVYRYDRRGRGDSGDAAVYAPEREVDDLAAVIAAAGDDAFVFGQSSGAALSLETASTGAPVRAVLANEPPYPGTEGSSYEMADQLAELVASGYPEQAAERVYVTPALRMRWWSRPRLGRAGRAWWRSHTPFPTTSGCATTVSCRCSGPPRSRARCSLRLGDSARRGRPPRRRRSPRRCRPGSGDCLMASATTCRLRSWPRCCGSSS